MDREKQLQAKFGYLQAEVNELVQRFGLHENGDTNQILTNGISEMEY